MSAPRYRWITWATIAVYLVAAWCSTGFQSADEQYQVITFAQWKVADPTLDILPWEFHERIRSSLLPWVAVAVFKSTSLFGADDPFIRAFLLRALTALFALFAVRSFIQATLTSLPEALREPYVLVSVFLWFLPFQLVRFSSETWALICLLHALAAVYRMDRDERWPWRSGVWLAVMLCLKPSMLPVAAGIGCWVLVMRGAVLPSIAKAAASVLIVGLASAALDSAFYGGPTFAFSRYMSRFPSHPDHVFDTSPWWIYAPWVLKYGIAPIGACILVAFILVVRYQARSLLVWALLPMLVTLSLVPHKELRFLFPLAGLVPLLLLMAFAEVQGRWKAALRWRGIGKPVLIGITALNVIALAVVVSTPAGYGRTRLAQHIQHRYGGAPVRIEYAADPKDLWDIRIPKFYLPPNSKDTVIAATDAAGLAARDGIHLLITNKPVPPAPSATGVEWVKVIDALPAWKELALPAYDLEDAKPAWTLYRAHP